MPANIYSSVHKHFTTTPLGSQKKNNGRTADVNADVELSMCPSRRKREGGSAGGEAGAGCFEMQTSPYHGRYAPGTVGIKQSE